MTEFSPPLEDPQEFVGWLRSLDDDRLIDYRFEIYDRAELAPNAEGLRAALTLVCGVERERRWLRELRSVVFVEYPHIDPDAFASAVESGMNSKAGTVAEVLGGAVAFGAAVRQLENPHSASAA